MLERSVFMNWFKNLLSYNNEELTSNEINRIKNPEEVLPMLAENLEKYREELIEKGIEKGRIDDAKNMYKEGAELEFISRVTGFTIEKIKKLLELI